jgi:hypothetical protein
MESWEKEMKGLATHLENRNPDQGYAEVNIVVHRFSAKSGTTGQASHSDLLVHAQLWKKLGYKA